MAKIDGRWSLTADHLCDMCSTSEDAAVRRNCGRQLPATKGDIEDLYHELTERQRAYLDELIDLLAEALRCSPIKRGDDR
jgi:hypothetical protein